GHASWIPAAPSPRKSRVGSGGSAVRGSSDRIRRRASPRCAAARRRAGGIVPDVYDVKPRIRERAHIQSMEEYQRLYRRSLEEPAVFWAEQADILDWFHPW